MKLTDVARASLSELRGDYGIYILDREQLPWSVHSPEAKAVNAVSLDAAPFTDDLVHESARHALEQRKKYARWLDSEDAVVVANAMLVIIGRALNMLKSQIRAQGKATSGGAPPTQTAKALVLLESTRSTPSIKPAAVVVGGGPRSSRIPLRRRKWRKKCRGSVTFPGRSE